MQSNCSAIRSQIRQGGKQHPMVVQCLRERVSEICSVLCRPVQPEHRVWNTREYTQCRTFVRCFVDQYNQNIVYGLHLSTHSVRHLPVRPGHCVWVTCEYTQYKTFAQCFVDQYNQNIVCGLRVSTHSVRPLPVQPEHCVWVTREYTQCQTFAQCSVNHDGLHASIHSICPVLRVLVTITAGTESSNTSIIRPSVRSSSTAA